MPSSAALSVTAGSHATTCGGGNVTVVEPVNSPARGGREGEEAREVGSWDQIQASQAEVFALTTKQVVKNGGAEGGEQFGQGVWKVMNRQQFLKSLQTLWKVNAEMNEPLTIDDLLDDAATIGLQGAHEMYMILLEDAKDVSTP